MFWLDRFPVPGAFGARPPGQRLFLGVLGLSLASGAGAWLELARLRAALRRRLPEFGLPWRDALRILLLALAPALPAALLLRLLPPSRSGLGKAVPGPPTHVALYPGADRVLG